MKATILILLIPFMMNGQTLSDKDLHVWAGFGISMTTSLVANRIVKKPIFACIIGAVVASSIGYAKETIWDGQMRKGTNDMSDFGATMYGGVSGSFGARITIGICQKRKDKHIDYYTPYE